MTKGDHMVAFVCSTRPCRTRTGRPTSIQRGLIDIGAATRLGCDQTRAENHGKKNDGNQYAVHGAGPLSVPQNGTSRNSFSCFVYSSYSANVRWTKTTDVLPHPPSVSLPAETPANADKTKTRRPRVRSPRLLFLNLLVPKRGLEPPHPCEYLDLNQARLPIPPFRPTAATLSKRSRGRAPGQPCSP